MKRIVIGFITVGLAMLAAPASASTLSLAGNDEMYQVSCDGSHQRNQLTQVHLAEQTVTTIGTGEGAPGSACASQGALIASTGWFYYVDWANNDRLLRTDLETGSIEVIGILHEGGAGMDIDSLAVGPGEQVYAIRNHNLYNLNLDDASVSLATAIDPTGLSLGHLYGFAYDPSSKHYYVVDDEGDSLYKLNVETGHLTYVATNSDFWVGSMDFDSDGYMWFNGDDNGVYRVWPSQFGNSSKIRGSGDLDYLGDNIYSESLQILRDPIPAKDKDNEGLAYTGAADISWVLGFAGIAGLGAVALRRRAK